VLDFPSRRAEFGVPLSEPDETMFDWTDSVKFSRVQQFGVCLLATALLVYLLLRYLFLSR
jgi:hypothetical protein